MNNNVIFILSVLLLVSCSTKPTSTGPSEESKKVVLGSVHPDHVRSTLRDQIPQFRKCLKESIDKKDIAVRLVFSVDKDGKSSKTDVEEAEELSKGEYECLIGVLNTTSFPKPLGGGSYDVKQPMKFYKKRN